MERLAWNCVCCNPCYPHALQATDTDATYNVPCLCTGTCSNRRALGSGDAARRSLSTDNCLDPSALNFNNDTTGEGSDCAYTKGGCADTAAINFDPAATEASRAW